LQPQGLSAPQLVAQVLINYQACLAEIFANGRDYPIIPEIHQFPVTWCGTFHGCVLSVIKHLLMPEIFVAWEEHCHGPLGQGLCIILGFSHYIGLLIQKFKDWLVIADWDYEYC